MRTFTLWIEGSDLWYNTIEKALRISSVRGNDFNQAVDAYVSSLPPRQARCWEYCNDDQCWKWSGRRAHDNEKAARAIYG